MKIVVIGGNGLIGKKLIPLLRAQGHDAQSASRSTGVNAVTGEGLAEALRGADVVVDVSNSPSFADDEVMQFFSASTRNLLAAEADAGVKHHVALSVVGADRLPDSGYMRAKVAQEDLIKSSSVPYTVLRATQFFEFLGAIAYGSTVGDIIRLPTAPMQPVAADEVAAALAEIATGSPENQMLELAGPESLSIAEFIKKFLTSSGDQRTVIADPNANYFGAKLDSRGLNPDDSPKLGRLTFSEWHHHQK
jgi:uncharacterized protein YbjT (DUF2867 family)